MSPRSEQSWRMQAMCDGLDADEIEAKFFPHPNDHGEEAKAICRMCPVAAECLTYALDTKQEFGVWGAMTERERAKLRGLKVKPDPTDSHRCGSYSGYTRHRKLGEALCTPCKQAARAYEQKLRAQKRQEGAA